MKTVQQVADSLKVTPAVEVVKALLEKESARGFLVNSAVRDSFIGLAPNVYHFVVSDTDPVEFTRKLAKISPGFATERQSETGTGGRYHGELGELHFIHSNRLNVPEYLDRNADFTVNSLAFDFAAQRIHAFHGAMEDIQSRLVRLVSNLNAISHAPDILLRAVSLALLTPTFTLTPQTHADIKSNCGILVRANSYGVGYELLKILNAKEYLKGIRMLNDLTLLPVLFKNFLPGALPDGMEEEEDVEGMVDPLELFEKIAGTIDALVPSHEFLRKNEILLRQSLLFTHRLREQISRTEAGQIKPFLISRGEQLESELNRLVVPMVNGFRVRMISVGYLAGIAPLIDRQAGADALEEAVERTLATFGAWKGLLSSVLICADWAATRGQESVAQADMAQVSDILQRMMNRHAGGRAVSPALNG